MSDVKRYVIQQNRGDYCLKARADGDLVDATSYDALRAEVERLRAGGCARDQATTQFCAEAVALQKEVERLKKRLESQPDYD